MPLPFPFRGPFGKGFELSNKKACVIGGGCGSMIGNHFGPWTPAEYMVLLKRTSAIIKKANPRAEVVAPGTSSNKKWASEMLKMNMLDYTDVFSYHGYYMNDKWHGIINNWAKDDGKDRLVFNTEDSALSSGRFFRKSFGGNELTGWNSYNESAALMVQSFITMLGKGTDVFFHFWAKPYAANVRHGSLFNFDGTIRTNAVAYSIAGAMTIGMQPYSSLKIGTNIRAYIFL